MAVEFENRLFVFVLHAIIVKGSVVPAVMYKLAIFIVLALPEATYPAGTPSLLPFFRIQEAVRGERCREFIATRIAALRELSIARQFEPDLVQRHGRYP